MIILSCGYHICTVTCEIIQSFTIRRIEYIGINPVWLCFYKQRWQHQMTVFDEFDVPPHTFEWSALIDCARQYAKTEELKDFAD